LIGLAMLAGEWLNVDAAAACVNFGAFAAFTAVNLCVLYDHLGGRRELPGGMFKVLQASAAALATLWLIGSLHRAALVVGALWLAAGLAYLALRTSAHRPGA
jgi:putrescine importer